MAMVRATQNGSTKAAEAALEAFRTSNQPVDLEKFFQACMRLCDDDMRLVVLTMHRQASIAELLADIFDKGPLQPGVHGNIYFQAKMFYGRLKLIDPELSPTERLAAAKKQFVAVPRRLANSFEKIFLDLILANTAIGRDPIKKIFELCQLAFPKLHGGNCYLEARSYLFYLAQTGSPEAPETLLACEVIKVILQQDLNPTAPDSLKRYGRALYELYAPALTLCGRELPKGDHVQACRLFTDLTEQPQNLGFYLYAAEAYHSVIRSRAYSSQKSAHIHSALAVYEKIFALISTQSESLHLDQIIILDERLKFYAVSIEGDIELKKSTFAVWFKFCCFKVMGTDTREYANHVHAFEEIFDFLAEQGLDRAQPAFSAWYVSILVDVFKRMHTPANKRWLLAQLDELLDLTYGSSSNADFAKARKIMAGCQIRSGDLAEVQQGLATYRRLNQDSGAVEASERKSADGAAVLFSADELQEFAAVDAETYFQANCSGGKFGLEQCNEAISRFENAIKLGYEEGKLHLARLLLKRNNHASSAADLSAGLRYLVEYFNSSGTKALSDRDKWALIDLLTVCQAPAGTVPTPQQIQASQLLGLIEVLGILNADQPVHSVGAIGRIGRLLTDFRACFGIASSKLKQKVQEVLLDKLQRVAPENNYFSKLDTVEKIKDFIEHCYPSYVSYLQAIIDSNVRDMTLEYVSWLEDLLKNMVEVVSKFEPKIFIAEAKHAENARDTRNDKYCLLAKLYSVIKKHPQLSAGREAYYAELSKQALNTVMLLAVAPDPLILSPKQTKVIYKTLVRLVKHNCLDAFNALYRFHNTDEYTRRGVYLVLKEALATKHAASAAKRYGLEISVVEARHRRCIQELNYLAQRGHEYSGLAAWAIKVVNKADNNGNLDKVILQAAEAQDEETQLYRDHIQLAMQQTLGVISFSLQGVNKVWIADKLKEQEPAAMPGLAPSSSSATTSSAMASPMTVGALTSSSAASSSAPVSPMTVGALTSSSAEASNSSSTFNYKGPFCGSRSYFFGISPPPHVSSNSIIEAAVIGSSSSPCMFSQSHAAATSASASATAPVDTSRVMSSAAALTSSSSQAG